MSSCGCRHWAPLSSGSSIEYWFSGLALGALAVAPYALCVQFAQPIFGLTASGVHFLFPYLSGRAGLVSNSALKRTVLKAFLCNLLLVACGAGTLLLFGDRLIRIWAGAAVARDAAGILPPIVFGTALMGLSVTGTYTMQALGLFRTVALISLGGRAAMLLLMVYLLHQHGLRGLATARVCYGSDCVARVSAFVGQAGYREGPSDPGAVDGGSLSAWGRIEAMKTGHGYCRFILAGNVRDSAQRSQYGPLPSASS